MPATDDTNDGSDLDVVCLGNALVDVLAHTTDGDLAGLELNKGSMALVDLAAAAQIYCRDAEHDRGVRGFGGQHDCRSRSSRGQGGLHR